MHEIYMELAIKEAIKGRGKTYTNPLVGAVIVKDQKIIATGAHLNFGENHAEVNAILSCESPKELINSTLYVTLEPCCHTGKQPPCTDLIIKSGIKRVVIGQLDPNPLVSGMGIKKLKESGLEIVTGVLEEEVRQLNLMYNTFFEKNRPFVTLKQSMTLDGKLGFFQKRTPITSQETNNFIKKERGNYQAILVGSQTILTDNPTLKSIKNTDFPIFTVILDRQGRLFENRDLDMFKEGSNPVLLFTEVLGSIKTSQNTIVIQKKQVTISFVLQELVNRQIQSIYVEGGPSIHDAFLESELWDELVTYMSPKLIGGNGTNSFSSSREIRKIIQLEDIKIQPLSQDIRISGRRQSTCLQD